MDLPGFSHSDDSQGGAGMAIPEIAEASALPAHDVWFTWGHARDWARPDVDQERAEAYADWYVMTYVPGATDLGDLPSHPDVWMRFIRQS